MPVTKRWRTPSVFTLCLMGRGWGRSVLLSGPASHRWSLARGSPRRASGTEVGPVQTGSESLLCSWPRQAQPGSLGA